MVGSSSNSNSNMNSNSNGHGNSNSNGSRAGGVGKSEQSKRPISNDFRGDRDKDRDKARDKDRDRHYDDNVSHGKESQQSKPLPKAAFGGSILSAPRNMFSKVSKESAGPGSVASKSTASSMKKTFLGLAFGGRASSVSKERKGKNEQEGVGGGVGGGSKDKKGMTVLKGSTAQYDSEDDAYVSSRGGSRRGSDPRRYNERTGGDSHDSMGSIGRELNGQSEYLRMDKLSQDVMSEDQLERLLVQAKSVRSTTSRQPTR